MTTLKEILPTLAWEERVVLLKLVDEETKADLLKPLELLYYQIPPSNPWTLWVLQGGRASGKTFAGIQLIKNLILTAERKRIMIFSKEPETLRYQILECFEEFYQPFQNSTSILVWDNHSFVFLRDNKSDLKIKGKEWDLVWFDEPATYDNFVQPTNSKQTFISFTPCDFKFDEKEKVKTFIANTNAPLILTKGDTYRNFKNLDSSFVEALKDRYLNSTEALTGEFDV